MAKDQTKIALESMMGFVNERAMEIVALPLEQRAERYAMLKRINFDAAMQSGMSPKVAQEMADKTDEFIRAAVSIIENSGGGSQTTKPQ